MLLSADAGKGSGPSLFRERKNMKKLDDLWFNVMEMFCILKNRLLELYHRFTEF